MFTANDRWIYVYTSSTKKDHSADRGGLIAEPPGRYTFVESHSGGMHCCYTYYILELGYDFKVFARIDGVYDTVKISKVSDDGPKFLIELNAD